MKAIQTHYIGPTNTKGSRIVATAEGGKKPHRLVIPYMHEDGDGGHARAARLLCVKLGWTGIFVSGGLPNGDVAHVFTAGGEE